MDESSPNRDKLVAVESYKFSHDFKRNNFQNIANIASKLTTIAT